MRKLLFTNELVTIESEGDIVSAKWESPLIDLNTAVTVVKYRLEVTKGKTYPLLANSIDVKKITKEARDFLASERGCESVIASAILINSSAGTAMGNFFLKINKPIVPTKLFTNEAAAKEWLATFVKTT